MRARRIGTLVVPIFVVALLGGCGSTPRTGAISCSSPASCLSVGVDHRAPRSVALLENGSGLRFRAGWFYPRSLGPGRWGFRLEYVDTAKQQPVEELADPWPGTFQCPKSPGVTEVITTRAGRSICYETGGGNDTGIYVANGAMYQVDIPLPTRLQASSVPSFLTSIIDALR